jgi:Fe-S-cluster containining protein
MNKWSEQFNISFPECKMTGQCCRFASPSTPAIELIKKAAENSEFARDFFTIFIPYKDITEAENINPEIVQRTLNACKHPDSKVNENTIDFYHCRYLSDDNKCFIYEDRPQLCRDFPRHPFLVFGKGCAYEEWSEECKSKYYNLMEELDSYKAQLNDLKYQKKAINLLTQIQIINNKKYNFILLIPSMSIISPGTSWMKIF